jgi:TPR repeat protein
MMTIKRCLFFAVINLVALPLWAEQQASPVYQDEPLNWRTRTVRLSWVFDAATEASVVKGFNDTLEETLANVDGYEGFVELGGPGTPTRSISFFGMEYYQDAKLQFDREAFRELGLKQLQAELGLLEYRGVYQAPRQHQACEATQKALSGLPPTVGFSRIRLDFSVVVYNNTASDIVLSGSGDLPIFYDEKALIITKTKKPLDTLVVPPRHGDGMVLEYGADVDLATGKKLLTMIQKGFQVNLLRGQIKMMQKNQDLRLQMEMNSRRTYAFSISTAADQNLLTWRVKKLAGPQGKDLTVADIIEQANASGLKDDQGAPIFKMKDGRCVGVGALAAIGERYCLVADHGTDNVFFLWDWPLTMPIQGDVAIRYLDLECQASLSRRWWTPGVVQGLERYEALTHDPCAQVMLGNCLLDGLGGKQDTQGALAWFQKAIQQGSGHAMYALSTIYIKGKAVPQNIEESKRYLQKAAEAGYVYAQYHLGSCYEEGRYFAENIPLSLAWYRKAAEKGEARAQYQLGQYYNKGIGVKEDPVEACQWFRKAAEQGHRDAATCLGTALLKGKGVQQNAQEAIEWFRKAAVLNCEWGVLNFAYNTKRGVGTEKDAREAVRWYKRSALQGNSSGMLNLATSYQNGSGVEKDDKEAFKWANKSAMNGNAMGQCEVGYLYFNGFGVEKNGAEAFKWFKEAADLNYHGGLHGMALCYKTGAGVKQDPAQTILYLRRALEAGNQSAHKTLALCYIEGFGVKKDNAEAARLLRKAMELGVSGAAEELRKLGEK